MLKAALVPVLALGLIGAAPAAADPVVQQVREFADITAGQQAGGDKVLTFGLRGKELVVTAIALVASEGDPQPAAGAAAVMRTRSKPGDDPEMPAEADLNFVRSTGTRLFVVGEWTKPAILWEIERDREMGVRFRAVDAGGRAGEWVIPVNVPVDP